MSRLNDSDRAVYAGLADAMLPAHGNFPRASEAGVPGKLDEILGWRPDLAPDLLRGVASSRNLAPAAALTKIERDDPEAYNAIRFAVLGAYYLDAAVMKALHYGGQESRPVAENEIPDYQSSGLLEAVIARGPRWRHPEPISTKENSTMTKHVFMAFTDPTVGREDDYNHWQDSEHIPHGLQNPGFVGAKRYKLSDAQFGPGEGRSQYVTIWEIESDDIAKTLAEATERQKTAVFTDALNFNTVRTAVYSEVKKTK